MTAMVSNASRKLSILLSMLHSTTSVTIQATKVVVPVPKYERKIAGMAEPNPDPMIRLIPASSDFCQVACMTIMVEIVHHNALTTGLFKLLISASWTPSLTARMQAMLISSASTNEQFLMSLKTSVYAFNLAIVTTCSRYLNLICFLMAVKLFLSVLAYRDGGLIRGWFLWIRFAIICL